MKSERDAVSEGDALIAGYVRAGLALLDGHDNLASRRDISPEQLDGLFHLSYDRYTGGDYEGACRGFELLCLYDHENSRNWQGYGYSLLALKDYRKAAISLVLSSQFIGEDNSAWGDARLDAARALTHVGEKNLAQEILQTVVDSQSESAVREQATTLSEALGHR